MYVHCSLFHSCTVEWRIAVELWSGGCLWDCEVEDICALEDWGALVIGAPSVTREAANGALAIYHPGPGLTEQSRPLTDGAISLINPACRAWGEPEKRRFSAVRTLL